MRYKIQNFIVLLGSFVVGVPLGFVVGIVCWFKFPIQVYTEAKIKLTAKRIQEAEEFIEKHKKENSVEGMWERHIERIESQEKNHEN